MAAKWILLPVLAQMLLTYGLYWLMSTRRVGEIKAGEVKMADIAIETKAYGKQTRQFQNSLSNQFELPIFFFAISLFVYASGQLFWWEMALACFFVLARAGHSYIHVTSNHLVHRFRWFILGWAVMLLYMLSTGLRILMLG